MTNQDWYIINDVNTLDTPALVVYPDRVKGNIGTLISMIDDTARLRPHVKTFKNKEVAQLMMGAGISKFKCATIAEAEMLAMCGAPDVLLAYQPVGPKVDRFVNLIKAYPATRFSCLVDNLIAAAEISSIAYTEQIEIPVFIDINVGQNRTGISADEKVLQLYLTCDRLPGLKPVGLHAYDGHMHDPDLATRIQQCNASFEPVMKLRVELMEKELPQPVIIAGGSPTFPIHVKREQIECSPGTFVYWDKGYEDMLTEQPFLPAALVVARVISLPGDTTLCLDLGHKSVAAERELKERLYFLNAPELVAVAQSEEHLVVEAGMGHQYKIGDVLYGLPHHICPTVALYESAITIEHNIISGEWKNIARARKITM